MSDVDFENWLTTYFERKRWASLTKKQQRVERKNKRSEAK